MTGVKSRRISYCSRWIICTRIAEAGSCVSACDLRGAERIRRPWFVLDDDGLAEMLGGRFGQGPHGDVGRAARREGHDQTDRAGREGRRLRPGGDRRSQGAGQNGAASQAQVIKHVEFPPA
jgi:hypothetical protein